MTGRVVLVTGGAAGIGWATAQSFLLSPASAYVTGSTLTVDGGMTIHAGPDLEAAPWN